MIRLKQQAEISDQIAKLINLKQVIKRKTEKSC